MQWPIAREDRCDSGQIEAPAAKMGMGSGQLDRHATFSGANIHRCSNRFPREDPGERPRHRQRLPRHGAKETLEPTRIGIKCGEQISARLRLVWGFAGLKGLGERSPKAVETFP